MASPETVVTPVAQARTAEGRFAKSDRLFYVVAAVLMLISTAGGFRRFYLHGKAPWGEMTSQIGPLVVVHGIAMSSWVILFLVQSTLILTGYRRVHMVVTGRVGAVLAPLIVVLGSIAAALSVHFRPEIYGPLGGPRAFLATMLIEMVLFGTLVGVGLLYRRRPEIHRPMMLLATIVILSGSLGRFPYIENLAFRPPLYVWGPSLLFGGLLFLLQWAMSRAANRPYLIGYAGMVIASFLSVVVGNSELWNRTLRTFVP